MGHSEVLLDKGRFRARLGQGAADMAAIAALRLRCFGAGGAMEDGFDAACRHVMVEDRESGALFCCLRVLLLDNGRGLPQSYSAQFYDLSGLQAYAAPLAEIGRFCTDPAARDPDVLRLAWGAITLLVDRAGVGLLFGCASFAGTSPESYRDAFAWLQAHHLAPPQWTPREKAQVLHRFAAADAEEADAMQAMRCLPPLLRSYLSMGGWVSDHAVVDHRMNTLHVFTGLEVAAIPPARQRALRAVAG